MLKIAVFVSGGGTDLQSIIDFEKSGQLNNGTVALVISNRKKAYGLERAKHEGIEAIWEKDQHKIIEILEARNIDLIVLAGYLAILSEEFVKKYEHRIINIHPSLIPAFCGDGMYGIHVHEAVLKRGAKISGATVHFVNEITDGGPIILQEAVKVLDDDTPESLQARILEVEHKILPIAISLYCNNRLEINNGKVRIKNEKSVD